MWSLGFVYVRYTLKWLMLSFIPRIGLFLLTLTVLSGCKSESERGLVVDKALVVSAREEASKIGSDILERGGNAFDAMIATEFALTVAYPYAQSIGGGGFMVYRKEDGSIGSLDYREKAPLAASQDMYLDTNGNVIEGLSTLSAKAVAVPGAIAGLFEVHKKHGSLPMKDLIQPAIDLARRGVIVSQKQEERLDKYYSYFLELNEDPGLYSKKWKAGDTIVNLELANTLERIAQRGVQEFYKGQTAKTLVEFIQNQGGTISLEDLEKYKPVWRDPVESHYDNLHLISMAPPSSGGICLAQILNSVEAFELDSLGHNSTSYIQVLTEAERRAYADRSHYLGDPDFVDIPDSTLISKSYCQRRFVDFSFEKAGSSLEIGYGDVQFHESLETTHYSIVDQYGNAIAATVTLNGAYGSKIYCKELGFFLNNEMDDFSIKPGTPNHYGLVGAEANKIEAEKRMLSSMTPTIIEKDGELWMVLGSPGGSTIITSVLQTILNVYEFDMTAQQAVAAPRFHHQWIPDQILMEPNGFDEIIINELEAKNYKIKERKSKIIGKVDAILVLENGKIEAGADPRGDDAAAGF